MSVVIPRTPPAVTPQRTPSRRDRATILLAMLAAALLMSAVGPLAGVAGEPFPWLRDPGESAPLLQTDTPPPTGSDGATAPDTGDSVREQLQLLQSEVADLRSQLGDMKKQSTAAAAPPAVVYPQIKMTGFFQADAGFIRQDAASINQFGDIQDDRGFRRTRLAATGKVSDNISYIIEMDFAVNGRPSFLDVWMDIAKVPLLGNVRVGQYRMPFGLDELTSVRELTFLERPAMISLAPFRQIGAGFHDTTADQNITWAFAGFGAGTDFWGNSIGDRGYGTAGRLTAVLLEDTQSDFLIHTGFGHSWFSTPNNRIQIRNVPEFGGPFGVPNTIPFFVDTGALAAENTNAVNAELAATWGNVHAQSELRYAFLNLNDGTVATLPAFYAQAGWILTGEHRPYNKTNAVLGRVKPKNALGSPCGIGAVELAARYSWIDLNDVGVNGGRLNNISGVLNWYLNDYAKLQFQGISADLTRAPTGSSQTDIFAIRAQLDF